MLISCITQAGFIGFTGWVLQTFTDDISLDLSKIGTDEKQRSGIMFITLLDYAESSISSINEYVIGEVPHDFDTDIPIEIIGFDCESCEKKVRVIL